MGTTEIKVNDEKVKESLTKLKDISGRLDICKSQNLLLEESAGEAAEQTKVMYQEVLSVVGAMKDLVDQTVGLVDAANKEFQEADNRAADMFSAKG